MLAPRRHVRRAVLLLGAPVAAAVVYCPILRNYFFADDFIDLQEIVNAPLLSYLTAPAGGHVASVRRAVFALIYRAVGVHPPWYFATLLATHVLNVWLLFTVIRTLTRSEPIACFGAGLWGVLRAHEEVLGWYSVYGHALATTAVLALLALLARATRRAAPVPVTARDAVVWALLLLVASASFGVGIGVALAFPAIALLLVPRERCSRAALAVIASVPLLVLAMYVLASRAAQRVAPDVDLVAIVRWELVTYWRVAIVMFGDLLLAGLRTVVRPFAVPGAPHGVADWAPVALLAAGLASALTVGPQTCRRPILAALLLVIACDGMIAAGRAVLFVSIGENALAGRYQYLATAGITIALCLVVARAGEAVPGSSRVGRSLFAAASVLATLLWLGSDWRIDHFDAERRATERIVAEIDAAIASTPAGEPTRIPNRHDFPLEPIAARYVAGRAAAFTIFFPSDVIDGHSVFFVESDPRVRAMAPPGSLLAAVLRAPSG